MPATPRWLLSLPDAVAKLERHDADVLTRRDLQDLLGVSRTRAHLLMRALGAGKTANILTLRRVDLVRRLRTVIGGHAFVLEHKRRERLVDRLRRARTASVRVPASSSRGRATFSALRPESW